MGLGAEPISDGIDRAAPLRNVLQAVSPTPGPKFFFVIEARKRGPRCTAGSFLPSDSGPCLSFESLRPPPNPSPIGHCQLRIRQ